MMVLMMVMEMIMVQLPMFIIIMEVIMITRWC